MASGKKELAALPPVTVARFEHVTLLIQRLAQEKTGVFLKAMTGYQAERHQAASRPLTHAEALGAAEALAGQLGRDDHVQLATEIQDSGLRVTDPPEPRELLLAAGIRTAPAFLDVALQVCALIEMDPERFEYAIEAGDLARNIDELTVGLRQLSMGDARRRASAALEHFAKETTGASLGEAVRLLTGTVWQALSQALDHTVASASSSSMLSAEPTDGPAETFSTG